ncbi:hypothetical protein LINPERHAP1_LOCUS7477 [Linum perenne]
MSSRTAWHQYGNLPVEFRSKIWGKSSSCSAFSTRKTCDG